MDKKYKNMKFYTNKWNQNIKKNKSKQYDMIDSTLKGLL